MQSHAGCAGKSIAYNTGLNQCSYWEPEIIVEDRMRRTEWKRHTDPMIVTGSVEEPFLTYMNGERIMDDCGLRRRRRRRGHCDSYVQDSLFTAVRE